VTPEKKAHLIATAGAWIVRLIVATLRIRVHDEAGVLGGPSEPRLIWVFWHNQLFVIPHLLNRYLPQRPGSALTSASKDGEILAAFLQRFHILPIRGSSSRRGAASLLEMKRLVARGYDVAITPDGPRGPRYRLSAGPIALAQKTGALVMPHRVQYSGTPSESRNHSPAWISRSSRCIPCRPRETNPPSKPSARGWRTSWAGNERRSLRIAVCGWRIDNRGLRSLEFGSAAC
jgi:lysophospholipid acyltransferase (LPLAT)-like uncharacterized protein